VLEVQDAGTRARNSPVTMPADPRRGQVCPAEGALRRDRASSRRFLSNSISAGLGAARLLIAWDRPRFFKPLPLDYCGLRRPVGAAARPHLALAGLTLWWGLFPSTG
jgi:hypothetical protein